jgi:hypothetical protein
MAVAESLVIELAADELVVRQGDHATRLELGPQAPEAIELRVGGSVIRIDAKGITLKGLNVKIEGELGAELKGGVQTSVHSDGVAVLRGGLTKIN